MRTDVPPPGKAMTFPEWSAAIVAGASARFSRTWRPRSRQRSGRKPAVVYGRRLSPESPLYRQRLAQFAERAADVVIARTHAANTAATSTRYDGIESEDVVEIDDEDLAAFNSLVQDGLIEVVMIEDGQPFYRIASEFAGPLEPSTGPGR
jgi:hypothetical protein